MNEIDDAQALTNLVILLAQDATKLYESECFQNNGAAIPARHRVLPHVMVDKIHQRAFSTLAVFRKHDFVTQSPAHTRAMTISQRGYVESHKSGLTEFHSLEDLSHDLTSFTLMKKLAMIKNFREYKIFRNWELLVRQRKFKLKVHRLEGLMLLSHKGVWACVLNVQVECVALLSGLKAKDLRPPSTGFTTDALAEELRRRQEILQESLENTRQSITEKMDKYFSAVSQEVSVERLRKVFKHNRDYDPKAAEAKASEDMHLLCRLFCMAEQILNQTAVSMHNEELARVCRMFDVEMLGSIQTESFMQMRPDADVSLNLPYTKQEENTVASNVEIILMPNGQQLLDTITKEMNQIYHSLSYTMRPRLLPKLDQYVASKVLSKYIGRKPDYLHCVTNSRLYALGYAHLQKVVQISEVSTLELLAMRCDLLVHLSELIQRLGSQDLTCVYAFQRFLKA